MDWYECFRKGFAPQISTAGLRALAEALETDDPRLWQGVTTAVDRSDLRQPIAACPVAYCGWVGDGIELVGDIEAYFGRVTCKASNLLNEPASGRYFTNWVDSTPRADMRAALLPEVRAALAQRGETP